eukprot:scaffold5743_cov33-Phaeocystis_antarctica.AAC.1
MTVFLPQAPVPAIYHSFRWTTLYGNATSLFSGREAPRGLGRSGGAEQGGSGPVKGTRAAAR